MKSSTYPSENEETSLLTATAIKYLPIMGSYQWPPYIVQENTKSSKCINVETERDLSRTSSSKALLIAGSARAGSSGLCPVCPCAPYWRAQSWTQYLDVASMAVLNRGREHLLWPADSAPPNTAQEAVGFPCHKGTLQAHIYLVSTRTLRALPSNLLFSLLISSLYWCKGWVLPRHNTFQFP